MSQFKFGDRVKVDGGVGVYIARRNDTESHVFYKGHAVPTVVPTCCIRHATEQATAPVPSDEIDGKIIASITQLQKSLRHWLGAILNTSVPQHGLSETSRIYHMANELEQRLSEYQGLLSANIASRQEGAACGS